MIRKKLKKLKKKVIEKIENDLKEVEKEFGISLDLDLSRDLILKGDTIIKIEEDGSYCIYIEDKIKEIDFHKICKKIKKFYNNVDIFRIKRYLKEKSISFDNGEIYLKILNNRIEIYSYPQRISIYLSDKEMCIENVLNSNCLIKEIDEVIQKVEELINLKNVFYL